MPEQEQPSRKRKLSTDEKEDDDSAKKHKSNDEQFKRPIAPFTPRPRSVRPNTRRGKSVKLPQKTLSRSDIQNIKEVNATENTTKEEEKETGNAPERSNDDFRAMLLSSKK